MVLRISDDEGFLKALSGTDIQVVGNEKLGLK
jgi:hypothetical protein